jgi:DNA-binding GntR family transcriptional regulator
MSPSNLQPRSLAEHAADYIRRQIVTGCFDLGEALSETTLAAALGISKTPVREALRRLETEGLVVIQPQRGTYVFRMSVAEVRLLGEFREVLEVAALRLAMRKDAAALGRVLKLVAVDMDAALARGDTTRYRELDAGYHERIIEHCANQHFARSYGLIAFRIQALRNRLSSNRALNAASLKEHRTLANLVARGMEGKAVALLRQHMAKTVEDFANTTPSEALLPTPQAWRSKHPSGARTKRMRA